MRFKSKQNKVVLKDGIVIKTLQSEKELQREIEVLKKLKAAGLAVPAVLGAEKNSLLLEYIAGPTYEALVENMTCGQAESLAEWLTAYREITGALRGDVNLRNFIWSKETCFGVDFNDPPTFGEREVDQGKTIAFAATYDPPFTSGKAQSTGFLLRAFLKRGGRRAEIKKQYLLEIAAVKERRRNANFKLAEAAAFFEKLNGM